MQLPESFIHQIRTFLKGESEFFFKALKQEPAVSIRLNPFKETAEPIEGTPVPWSQYGLYLNQRPAFIFDPLFHAGAYYVQESSSMFLEHVIKSVRPHTDKPIKVLDLCAAPGGKSTLLSSLLKPNDLLVANEPIKSRLYTLAENIIKWGVSNTIVTQNDPKDFTALKSGFDLIVVDAPCSGEGMFRKDDKAIEEWSEANVQLCVGRQKRILADIIPSLKPGGYLVYSTCTFNQSENEENVKWMQEQWGLQTVKVPVEPFKEIDATAEDGFRFWPHRVKGEGLFMVCLQKTSTTEAEPEEKKWKKKNAQLPAKTTELLKPWLNDASSFIYYSLTSGIRAIPACHQQVYEWLDETLYIVYAGIDIGEIKQQDIVPHHALALSVDVSPDIPRTELSREQALVYLKKGVLLPNSFSGKGWQLVTYGGLALGWVKVLPNRINNYLPVNNRILKDLEMGTSGGA